MSLYSLKFVADEVLSTVVNHVCRYWSFSLRNIANESHFGFLYLVSDIFLKKPHYSSIDLTFSIYKEFTNLFLCILNNNLYTI